MSFFDKLFGGQKHDEPIETPGGQVNAPMNPGDDTSNVASAQPPATDTVTISQDGQMNTPTTVQAETTQLLIETAPEVPSAPDTTPTDIQPPVATEEEPVPAPVESPVTQSTTPSEEPVPEQDQNDPSKAL